LSGAGATSEGLSVSRLDRVHIIALSCRNAVFSMRLLAREHQSNTLL